MINLRKHPNAVGRRTPSSCRSCVQLSVLGLGPPCFSKSKSSSFVRIPRFQRIRRLAASCRGSKKDSISSGSTFRRSTSTTAPATRSSPPNLWTTFSGASSFDTLKGKEKKGIKQDCTRQGKEKPAKRALLSFLVLFVVRNQTTPQCLSLLCLNYSQTLLESPRYLPGMLLKLSIPSIS